MLLMIQLPFSFPKEGLFVPYSKQNYANFL